MNAAERSRKRRDLLKRAAILGGAGAVGAGLMGGLDRSVLATPRTSSTFANRQSGDIQVASCIVFVDSRGSYNVEDAGVGPDYGALIVDANAITAYGASLGAGTSGASTTTAGIQEAVNCLRGKGGLGGGKVALAAGIYSTTSTITLYPGIAITGLGLLSAFANIGSCAIQPAETLNAPVILIVVDPNNTGNVVFPRCEGFAINGPAVTNPGQDGIQISNANGNILDCYIRDVGVFGCGGNGLNIQCNGGAGKFWVQDLYVEDNLQSGINQNGGYLQVRGGYQVSNALYGINSSTSQLLEIFNHRFEGHSSPALNVTGPISYGINVHGCHFNKNGGATTPQIALARVSGVGGILICNNKFTDGRGGGVQCNNHIVIGSSSGGTILGNSFFGSSNVAVDPGSFNIMHIRNNYGLNPINKITNPFTASNINYLHGSAAVPTPSTDYTVCNCDIFITAANSANADNAILVKDSVGNTVLGPVGTLTAQWVPIGYKLNWGAFTGNAGAVTVFGN